MTSTISASAERQLERRANHKLAVLHHVEEVNCGAGQSCHLSVQQTHAGSRCDG